MSALRVLLEPHRHGFHLPWLDAVRPGLDDVELWPLLALSPPPRLDAGLPQPGPAGPATDIADQLAQVRATPPDQVAQEVERRLTQRAGGPPLGPAWQLLDDPVATRDLVAGLLEQCWHLLVAPHWPRLRDLLQADLRFPGRAAGRLRPGPGARRPGLPGPLDRPGHRH